MACGGNCLITPSHVSRWNCVTKFTLWIIFYPLYCFVVRIDALWLEKHPYSYLPSDASSWSWARTFVWQDCAEGCLRSSLPNEQECLGPPCVPLNEAKQASRSERTPTFCTVLAWKRTLLSWGVMTCSAASFKTQTFLRESDHAGARGRERGGSTRDRSLGGLARSP